jgi:hypothetical protein
MPEQVLLDVDRQLDAANQTIKAQFAPLNTLARHVLDLDNHHRAWTALQQLADHEEDFLTLAAADAADHHQETVWGSHYTQAKAAADVLANSVHETQELLSLRAPGTDGPARKEL